MVPGEAGFGNPPTLFMNEPAKDGPIPLSPGNEIVPAPGEPPSVPGAGGTLVTV